MPAAVARAGVARAAGVALLLAELMALAGCMQEPILPGYAYRPQPPAPPPLQPYVEPVVTPAPPVVTTQRTIKRRYVRRSRYRRQVRCPCLPVR